MQFLDCVYQLLEQYPLDFEFNEILLLDTIDNLYSGRFGTFFFNNERERREQKLPEKTTRYVFFHFIWIVLFNLHVIVIVVVVIDLYIIAFLNKF